MCKWGNLISSRHLFESKPGMKMISHLFHMLGIVFSSSNYIKEAWLVCFLSGVWLHLYPIPGFQIFLHLQPGHVLVWQAGYPALIPQPTISPLKGFTRFTFLNLMVFFLGGGRGAQDRPYKFSSSHNNNIALIKKISLLDTALVKTNKFKIKKNLTNKEVKTETMAFIGLPLPTIILYFTPIPLGLI